MQANPYQAPAADLSAPMAGDYDQSNPFSPSGRFGRLSYLAWGMLLGVAMWAFMLVVLGVSLVGHSNEMESASRLTGGVMLLAVLVLIPAVIFAIRRLHDFNASGWWVLLLIVPLVSAIFALVLLFRPGDAEANRFAPPRLTRTWEKVLAYIAIGFMIIGIIGIIAAIAIPMLAAR